VSAVALARDIRKGEQMYRSSWKSRTAGYRSFIHITHRFPIAIAFIGLLSLALQPPPVIAADASADVAVTLSASRSQLKRGETVTLTIRVTNNGPDTATGITLGVGTADTLGLLGIVCPDGPPPGGFCQVESLASGASFTATATVTTASGDLDKAGNVVASVTTDGLSVDPVSTNDSAVVTLRIVGKRTL
jgi:hypothetical protein